MAAVGLALVLPSVLMLTINGAKGTTIVADTIASITTDKTKYSVGESMTITGTGFTPNGAVTVTVLRADHKTDTLPTVTADGSGGFTTTYAPPSIH